MKKFVICIRPDGKTEFYLKSIDPADKSVSVWHNQDEAQQFNSKNEAQELINVNYLKHATVRTFKP